MTKKQLAELQNNNMLNDKSAAGNNQALSSTFSLKKLVGTQKKGQESSQ